jgi:hypothetical protein
MVDGVGWKVNRSGTTWTFRDPNGTHGGIKRAVVKDRSRTMDGLVRWSVRGAGGAVVLPPVSGVRSSVVLGAAAECATTEWNPPGAARPRCDGDAAKLACR